jgi:Tol biopolymer transport system component
VATHAAVAADASERCVWLTGQAMPPLGYSRPQPLGRAPDRMIEGGASMTKAWLLRTSAIGGVVMAAALAAAPAEAAFPGANGKIAVARYVPTGGPAAVLVVNPNGTGFAKLITDGINQSPYWSADGSKIAFQRITGNPGGSELFQANADGTGVVQLTHNQYWDEGVRWSPSGDRIVFTSQRPDNWDLYLKDLGSGHVTRLTDSPAVDWAAEFSPDGTAVAFVSTRSGGHYDIWTKNLTTGAVARVTTFRGADLFPSWSPDGSKIAFQSMRSGSGDIWVKNLNTGVSTRITTSPYPDRYPAWSPDGTKIVFSASNANGITNLWTVKVNTLALNQVTSQTGGLGFGVSSWQPT